MTLSVVVLANWLLLEHPQNFEHAQCAQVVVTTSAIGVIFTCLLLSMVTRKIFLLTAVLFFVLSLPMSTLGMTSARVCGLAPDISVMALLLPTLLIISMVSLFLFSSSCAGIKACCASASQVGRGDTERCCYKNVLVISSWVFVTLTIAFLYLLSGNLESDFCVNWGLVMAPMYFVVNSAFVCIDSIAVVSGDHLSALIS